MLSLLLKDGMATTTFQTFWVVDARTLHEERVQEGKVTATQSQTVSEDGRTLTISSEGSNAGQRFRNVVVYDKQ